MSALAPTRAPDTSFGSVMFGLQAIMLLGAAIAAGLGFLIYGMGRSLEFGWDWALAGRFLVYSPLYLLPPVVLTLSVQSFVCDLNERRQTRRLDAGRCPLCEHPLPPSPADVCTECGAAKLTPHRASRRGRMYLRTAAAAAVGACLGAAAVEVIMGVDEVRFRREVDARPLTAGGVRGVYSRNRVWPFKDSALVWNPATGFHGTD